MGLIQAVRAVGVTIHAYNSDGSKDWTAPEVLPILMQLGVTISAPDLFFYFPNQIDAGAIGYFIAQAFDADDRGEVTFEGDPTTPGIYAHVGFPSARASFEIGPLFTDGSSYTPPTAD